MRILEIFKSIHGECNGHTQGRIVTFIRVSGCNLKCRWGLTRDFKVAECDTVISQDPKNGHNLSIGGIIDTVQKIGCKYICITGGEPLLSKYTMITLLYNLKERGYKISIETNGTRSIEPFRKYVESFVVDYKGFTTGYNKRMVRHNYPLMGKKDVLKFPISCDEEFYDAMGIITQAKQDGCKAMFAFSPVYGMMSPHDLADLIFNSGLNDCILSVQLHKIIGVS